MSNYQNRREDEIYGVKVRAGRKRTYFFDVKQTKQGDYYVCITESKRRFDDSGFDRHKIYIYKEDFNKFQTGLEDVINHVKTELLPDFDFDSFTRDPNEEENFKSTSSSDIDPMSIYDEAPLNVEDTSKPSEDSSSSSDVGESW